MKTYTRIATAVSAILVLFSLSVFSQTLVSSASHGLMSAADLNDRMDKVFGSYQLPPAPSVIELHKITYTSLDANNKKVNLTGLVAWPGAGAPKGLVVFCHGTTVDRDRSPSKFKGKGEAPETVEAIVSFAAGGYAVVLPDYLGMGDNKSAHPYPLNVVNARSGVDIIPAARTLAKQKGYVIGDNLYVTGYSEGGGIAMALTRSLQAMIGPQYKVTASAPASGPYDLSNTTRKFMMRETGEQVGFILRLYLMSYATNYLRKEKGHKLTEFYKPVLANALYLKYLAGPSDEGLLKQIGITTTLMRSQNKLANVLNPQFLQDMQANNRKNEFVRMLVDNDVYDWSPRTPLLLINLEGDTIVDPENTTVAYNAMRRRGVTNATVRRYIIIDPNLTHLNAVAAAMSKARAFFDNGFNGVPDAK